MTPAGAFFVRWTAKLSPEDCRAFFEELAVLVTTEQARERRRLATDRRYYEQAGAETARELGQA